MYEKDVKEAIEVVQSCTGIYSSLKNDGSLDKLYNEIGTTYRRMRQHMAQVDMEVLKIYQNSGLSMEQSLQLLIANKVNFKEAFNKAISSKNTNKKQ